MNCPYCHNPDLARRGGVRIDLGDTLGFLKRRRRFLEGVTFSGGECLLSPAIVRMARAVKEIGYSLKIDTNGSMPDRLEVLIDERLVDYVAMDFKAPIDDYKPLTGWGDVERWIRSFDLLRTRGIDHELRTTVHVDFTDEKKLDQMMDWLEVHGFNGNFFVQNFQDAPLTSGRVKKPSRRFDITMLKTRRDFQVGFRNFTSREIESLG